MKRTSKATSIRLQISEPWDFEIPGKGNILNGIIEGICPGPTKKNWQGDYVLVSLREAITWEGEVIKQLLLSPRYKGDIVADIQNGKHVIVGMARVRPNISLKASAPFTPEQVDYFAIGSVEALQSQRGSETPRRPAQ